MMSRMSQMGMITHVEGTSRLRANLDDRQGGGQQFAQLLKQESDRLDKAQANGVGDAETVDLIKGSLEGKMNTYTNRGIVNYFKMMTSMTDLRG